MCKPGSYKSSSYQRIFSGMCLSEVLVSGLTAFIFAMRTHIHRSSSHPWKMCACLWLVVLCWNPLTTNHIFILYSVITFWHEDNMTIAAVSTPGKTGRFSWWVLVSGNPGPNVSELMELLTSAPRLNEWAVNVLKHLNSVNPHRTGFPVNIFWHLEVKAYQIK